MNLKLCNQIQSIATMTASNSDEEHRANSHQITTDKINPNIEEGEIVSFEDSDLDQKPLPQKQKNKIQGGNFKKQIKNYSFYRKQLEDEDDYNPNEEFPDSGAHYIGNKSRITRYGLEEIIHNEINNNSSFKGSFPFENVSDYKLKHYSLMNQVEQDKQLKQLFKEGIEPKHIASYILDNGLETINNYKEYCNEKGFLLAEPIEQYLKKKPQQTQQQPEQKDQMEKNPFLINYFQNINIQNKQVKELQQQFKQQKKQKLQQKRMMKRQKQLLQEKREQEAKLKKIQDEIRKEEKLKRQKYHEEKLNEYRKQYNVKVEFQEPRQQENDDFEAYKELKIKTLTEENRYKNEQLQQNFNWMRIPDYQEEIVNYVRQLRDEFLTQLELQVPKDQKKKKGKIEEEEKLVLPDFINEDEVSEDSLQEFYSLENRKKLMFRFNRYPTIEVDKLVQIPKEDCSLYNVGGERVLLPDSLMIHIAKRCLNSNC